MAPPVSVGDEVHTPLGRGVIREVRGGGRLLVEIAGRKVVVETASVKPVEPPRKSSRKNRAPSTSAVAPIDAVPDPGGGAPADVDLHGLTVNEAMARVDSAVNEVLLAGRARLRVIHGRSGGRIKAALHRHLRELPPVRGFRIDPRNEGVTIVEF